MTASGTRALPFAYRFAVAILRPLLMVFTKRDWHGAENLPATGGFVVCAQPPLLRRPAGRSPTSSSTTATRRSSSARRASSGSRSSGRSCAAPSRSRSTATPVRPPTPSAPRSPRCEAGKCVAVYPEGTLTRDPDLWPMVGKTGAARIALATRCPVIPVAQWGPQEMLAPYGKRLQPAARARRCRSPPGRRSTSSDLYDQPVTGALLREATDRIMDGDHRRARDHPRREGAGRALRLAQARPARDRQLPPQARRRRMTTAAVFGTGSWGTAYASVLADGGTTVRDVGPPAGGGRPDQRRVQRATTCPTSRCRRRSRPPHDPAEAADGADIVVLAVPSQTLRANLGRRGVRCCRRTPRSCR